MAGPLNLMSKIGQNGRPNFARDSRSSLHARFSRESATEDAVLKIVFTAYRQDRRTLLDGLGSLMVRFRAP
jgi:hypothetical protein